MKFLLLLWLGLAATSVAIGQQYDSTEYPRLMREANDFTKKGEYDKALAKYRSAEESNRRKKDIVEDSIFNLKNLMRAPKVSEEVIVKKPQVSSGAGTQDRVRNESDSGRQAHGGKGEAKGEIRGELRKTSEMDSLKTYTWLMADAHAYDSVYRLFSDRDAAFLKGSRLPPDKAGKINFYSLRVLDYLYYMGWTKVELAARMLPVTLRAKYDTKVDQIYRSMEAHRKSVLHDYWMPDTLLALPDGTLFTNPSPDHKNFLWGYSDYADYKRVQVRFLNLSLPDFTITTDSLLLLADSGRFYSVTAASADYRIRVAKSIDYVLKRNKTEYGRIVYTKPALYKLSSDEGEVLSDLSQYTSNTFFLAGDDAHMATWEDGDQLRLIDLKTKKAVPLTDSKPAPTESMSADSKTIAYYNSRTQLIYLADMGGHVLDRIPHMLTGIDSITNIDFTGGDAFLKVNNEDTISLFDVTNRKMVMRFSKAFVDEIVVAPNGKDILLTCNTGYTNNGKSYTSSLGILTDASLAIKARLYCGGSTLFFTPAGDYIIGYGETGIMRWATGTRPEAAASMTCLTTDELISNHCLPLSQWKNITDADLIEKGARGYKDLAEAERDPELRDFYYRLSILLFHQLAEGHARNIRKERVPFFYDWHNWLDGRRGYRNFSDQFVRQLTGVKVFDRLVNSPDSVYPQQLYYAANANMLLANLYDSMGVYDNDVIEQINKEIVLRQRVFDKNPENTDNIYYYKEAFTRLSAVSDTVGWRDLIDGRYSERLAVYAAEQRLLAEKIMILPDSFHLKTKYVNALAQFSASFLYVHAGHYKGYGHALDSALYYADLGLALDPVAFDSARLLVVKARAYLLQPDGLERSMAIYQQVRSRYPDLTREALLRQLQFLREAGERQTAAMEKVEEYLKKN
jgi:hypothetical protein